MRVVLLFFFVIPVFLFGQVQIHPDILTIDDGTVISTNFENGSLIFDDASIITPFDRMRLYTTSLQFINAGQWPIVFLGQSGSSGLLELYAGGGTGPIFWVGPDSGSPVRGRLRLQNNGNTRAEMRVVTDAGIITTDGDNASDNTFLSWPSGRPNNGYIAVEDDNGQIQAALIVNADGTGSVFGDTKNFRMEHPEQPGKEIWYASVEGPEAAAYERGTATLEQGEAFIPFSDHFKLVINPETMTVILTPHSTNTYGLAVIEKTAEGIRVGELQNGTGQFSFDWEVKAVRKGYEDYRVIRDASEYLPGHEIADQESVLLEDDPVKAGPEEESESQAKGQFYLGQNAPNPFMDQSVIDYRTPADVSDVQLKVFDVQGKLVKTRELQAGEGRIQLRTQSMPAGTYSYSLIVDGVVKKTLQLVVQ